MGGYDCVLSRCFGKKAKGLCALGGVWVYAKLRLSFKTFTFLAAY